MSDHPNLTSEQRVARLEHRLRKLQMATVSAVFLLVAVVGASIIGNVHAETHNHANTRPKNASFNKITVHRIDVVAPDGKNRVVISNAADLPPVILNGKTYKRKVSSAGFIFYDKKGNERGGIAVTPRHGGEQSNLTFDYNHSEAVSIFKEQNKKFTNAGLMILGLPSPKEPFLAGGWARIQVQVLNGKSEIVLRDAQGKPRLRFMVPKAGQPVIQFLNTKGKVTRELSSSIPK